MNDFAGILSLWGKFSNDDDTYHPVLFHTIDVGNVALKLFNECFTTYQKNQFRKILGYKNDVDFRKTRNTIAFFAAIHDIGKVTPVFQFNKRLPPLLLDRIKQKGYSINCCFRNDKTPHGELSQVIISHYLISRNINRNHSNFIGYVLGGHHGSLNFEQDKSNFVKGDGIWEETRSTIFNVLEDIFEVDYDEINISDDGFLPLMMFLGGFVSVADWLGSMQNYFAYRNDIHCPYEYDKISKNIASKAIEETGWNYYNYEESPVAFTTLFNDIEKPRPLQSESEKICRTSKEPSIFIIEAPTGEGKTEAAFYIADYLNRQKLSNGIYIALPTQATSNQMFGRTKEFIENVCMHGKKNIHLIHSNSIFSDDYNKLISIADNEHDEDSVLADLWFTQPKRGLLAQFAVGTIDQALLSVMQTRHFFVRLFGLGTKVVIFDEIHAYDTYMNTIIERLIEWLSHIGVSVILLSATLPQSKRQRMLECYMKSKELQQSDDHYPRITVANNNEVKTLEFNASSNKELQLRFIDENDLTKTVKSMLEQNGFIAIIRNTVAEAQETYRMIKDSEEFTDSEIFLLHSRFLLYRRQEIEKTVLDLFGKDNDNRNSKKILISTQIIEQSLDLDFDGMITDFAPVDLLLQRAGRLHRHSKNDSIRPDTMKITELKIISPTINDAKIDFGKSVYVYDEYILLKSFEYLKDKTKININSQIEEAVNTVYSDEFDRQTECNEQVITAFDKLNRKDDKHFVKAKFNLIPKATLDMDDFLNNTIQDENEDSAMNNGSLVTTRLTRPSVKVICLQKIDDDLHTFNNDSECLVNLKITPTKEMAKRLISNSVTVSKWKLVKSIEEKNMIPTAWNKSRFMKGYHLLEFVYNRCHIDGIEIIYDENRGIIINE